MTHTITDISKKSGILKLRDQRASDYLNIVNSIKDMIFFQTDMKGQLIDVSDSISRITGFTREEVVTKPVSLLYSSPDDHFSLMKELLLHGKAEEYRIDLKSKNGSVVKTIMNSSVIHDESGAPFSILSTLQDITESDRVIESCRYSEDIFKAITQSIQDAIIMMDDRGLISFVNRACIMMFGYAKEEMLNADLHELIAPPQYLSSFRHGFKSFKTSGEGLVVGRTLEIEARRKSGSVFPVELSISSVKVNDSWYSIGIIRDITERKRAERDILEASEAAENASRTKSEFLANMSHEVRTPLNAMIGATGLLFETDIDDEQMKLIEMMHSSGESLLTLINDILDISSIEAGKITLEKIPFNLNDLLKRICNTLSVRSSEKNLEMTYEIKQGVPHHLLGDPNRLRQILVNLIGNAIKYTQRKGTISIRVEKDNSLLRFTIEDDGPGIPIGSEETVFERFTRFHKQVAGGTGLGLSINYTIIRTQAVFFLVNCLQYILHILFALYSGYFSLSTSLVLVIRFIKTCCICSLRH